MSTLFRQEAIDSQRRSAFGSITIHQPVALHVVTVAIFLIVMAAILFAATATFVKKEVAAGWIVPQGGMAQIYGPQGGLVRTVMVRPGQQVEKGKILATLSTDTFDSAGATGEQERRQLEAQEKFIETQISASRERMAEAARAARDQVNALKAEANLLTDERNLQSSQLELVQEQLANIDPIVRKGFISKFEQDRRRREILSIKQAISAIDRQIRERTAQMRLSDSELAGVKTRQATEEAQLLASRASLRVSRIGVEHRMGATLRAPISGTIASINEYPGETVQASLPVISIAPRGAVEAELLLPTRAAGLVQRGQAVRLQIDAFPFQRYGAIRGIVRDIGRAAVSPSEYAAPIPFKEASYRVRVRMIGGLMNSEGRLPQVQVGMTLSGSIVADKRTVLQWLVDPLRNR